MSFLLSGFSAKQNIKVQNGIIGSNTAIAAAYKELTQIRRTKTATRNYTTIFGAYDAGRVDQVWKVLNMMDYAASGSFITYIRNVGRPGTYAAAQRPKSGWSEKNVRQMLDKGEFTVKIDDAFYNADQKASDAILTVAHELSHLVGNTDDVDCPWDGETAYGWARVRRLAGQYPDLAIKNADNYGYYVARVGAPPDSGAEEADLGGLANLFA